MKKRSYNNFVEKDFLNEIRHTDFQSVLMKEDENQAAKKFFTIIKSVLDNHAPVTVFQTRNNYNPWVSDETKRNKIKEDSTKSNDPEVLKQYKKLRNHIKSHLENHEKTEYYQNKFKDANTDSGMAWKTAYQFLGKTQDLSPKHLQLN